MNIEKYEFAKEKLKKIKREEIDAFPYIKELPKRENYGLTDSSEEEIINIDTKFKINQKITDGVVFLTIIVLGFAFGAMSTYKLDVALMYAILSIIPATICLRLFFRKSPPKTKLHLEYERYKNDMSSYKYWEKKRSAHFWISLIGKGTEFERRLAELYNVHGYKAILTKMSGDGGVDIILEKNHQITLVQCKAHKVKISPGVAKKLDKYMDNFGVDKGILASISGFTEGVYKYIEDKKIKLIEVNDILKMM